jgi:hypothetical protein
MKKLPARIYRQKIAARIRTPKSTGVVLSNKYKALYLNGTEYVGTGVTYTNDLAELGVPGLEFTPAIAFNRATDSLIIALSMGGDTITTEVVAINNGDFSAQYFSIQASGSVSNNASLFDINVSIGTVAAQSNILVALNRPSNTLQVYKNGNLAGSGSNVSALSGAASIASLMINRAEGLFNGGRFHILHYPGAALPSIAPIVAAHHANSNIPIPANLL